MIKLMMLTRKKYHITLKKGFLYHSVSALSLSLSALSLSLSLTHSLSLSLPSLITRCLSVSIHAPLPYSLTPITPEAWCHEPLRSGSFGLIFFPYMILQALLFTLLVQTQSKDIGKFWGLLPVWLNLLERFTTESRCSLLFHQNPLHHIFRDSIVVAFTN